MDKSMLDLFPEYKKFINKVVVVHTDNKHIEGILLSMKIELRKDMKLCNVLILQQDTN